MTSLFKRIFKAGWQNCQRDRGLMFANIFILVLAIFTVSSIFLLKDVSDFVISGISEKVDVSVYFKSDVAEEDIMKAKDEIAKVPQVKEVEYVSQEEALVVFADKHKEDVILMQSLDEIGTNPFLASLNVKAFEASQYQAISDFLNKADFSAQVEKVDYYKRKPVIEKIFAFVSNATAAGIALSIILVIVAASIVYNTVRLSIYSGREEIKIQRLVGASNWFVRGPFVVQGAICGFFAALICLVIFTLFCLFFGPKMEVLFPGLNLFTFYTSNFWVIVLIQVSTGIGLGSLSSLIAVRRYLKI